MTDTNDYLAANMEQGRTDELLELQKKQTRAERFVALREEINALFQSKADAANKDGRIGNVFTVLIEDAQTTVGRTDRDGEATVKFDAKTYTAKFKNTGAVALNHTIEVKVHGQRAFLAHVEGPGDREITSSGIVAAVVEKAFRSLR